MTTYQLKSTKETQKFAIELAKKFVGGEVIGLIGNLGAGKTTLTQGIAKGLGVKDVVNSPTFVLMKIYKTKHAQIKKLIHLDAYRLTSARELINIGALDYFNQPDCLVIIEWADKVKKVLPKNAMIIKMTGKNKTRKLIIK